MTTGLLSRVDDLSKSSSPTTTKFLCRRNLLQAAAASSPMMFMLFLSAPQAAVARNLPESNGANDYMRQKTTGSVESLIPLVQLDHRLQEIQGAVMEMTQVEDLPRLEHLVHDLEAFVDNGGSSSTGVERKWKQLFDAYSNPVSYKQRFMDQNAFLVYYTKGFDGPGRPSMEQENENEIIQKQQYGARNDAWVAWQDICDQVAFFSEDVGSTSFAQEKKRLVKSLAQCQQAFDQYFQTVPPTDLRQARERLRQQ